MRKAFTLIELLVVIAIIAILAAILFPVFAQAKAAAKKTQALSNVKQLSTAYQLYLNDYDDVYFEAAQGWNTGTYNDQSLIWNGYLEPYKKSTELAIDPAAGFGRANTFNGVTYTGKFFAAVDRRQLSLGYNLTFTAQFDYACSVDFSSGTPACFGEVSSGAIQFPSQTLLFASSTPRNPGDNGHGAGYIVSPVHNINFDQGISDRHSGFCVVSFADSHAKAVKATALIVKDQVAEINPSYTGQCVNYDSAKVYWDMSAPLPDNQSTCEGLGLR